MALTAYNQGGIKIKVHRTGTATWEVRYNGTTIGSTFTSAEEADRFAFGLVSNAAVTERGLATKAATAEVQLVTLTALTDIGDGFSLQKLSTGEETIPFIHTTNCASTDLQTALRALTGDANLTVSGTINAGPFTVTWVDQLTRQVPLVVVRGVGGTTGAVTVSTKGGVG